MKEEIVARKIKVHKDFEKASIESLLTGKLLESLKEKCVVTIGDLRDEVENQSLAIDNVRIISKLSGTLIEFISSEMSELDGTLNQLIYSKMLGGNKKLKLVGSEFTPNIVASDLLCKRNRYEVLVCRIITLFQGVTVGEGIDRELAYEEVLRIFGTDEHVKTVLDIVERYPFDYLYSDGKTLTIGKSALSKLKNRVHSDFTDVDLKFAVAFISEKQLETLYGLGFSKLGHLDKFDARKISVKRDTHILESLSGSLTECISSKFESLKSNRGYSEFIAVAVNKRKLRDVGAEHNRTRERMRQLKNLYANDVLNLMLLVEEVLYQKGKLKRTMTFSEMEDIIGNHENTVIASEVVSAFGLSKLNYIREIEMFTLGTKLEDIEGKLNEITAELGEVIYIEEHKETINDMISKRGLEYVDIESFGKFISSSKYVRYGNAYIKYGATNRKLYETIVKRHFKNGMGSESVGKFIELALTDFNLNLADKDEDKMWKILVNTKNLVLWGRSKRMHIDNVQIRTGDLVKMRKVIAEALKKSPTVHIKYIYDKCLHLLKEDRSNIKDQESFYGFLKYHFGDVFGFHHLVVRRKGNTRDSSITIVRNYILSKGGIVQVDDLRVGLKWSEVMCNEAVIHNKELLVWNNGKEIAHTSYLGLSEELKKEVYKGVELSFVDNYTNNYMIHQNIKDILAKNNLVNDKISCYSLAKYVMGDSCKHRSSHMFKGEFTNGFTFNTLIDNIVKSNAGLDYDEVKEHLSSVYGVDTYTASRLMYKLKCDLARVRRKVGSGEAINIEVSADTLRVMGLN